MKALFKSPSSIQIWLLRKTTEDSFLKIFSENKRSSVLPPPILPFYWGTTFWSSPKWSCDPISTKCISHLAKGYDSCRGRWRKLMRHGKYVLQLWAKLSVNVSSTITNMHCEVTCKRYVFFHRDASNKNMKQQWIMLKFKAHMAFLLFQL